MDCAVEEAEIRRVLDPVAGITALRFQLGARVLAISAPGHVLPGALAAIRGAGFDPQPLAAPSGGEGLGEAQGVSSGAGRLVAALALAIVAELAEFFAPASSLATGLGMALAVAAIGLAGLETYTKGFSALRRGQLNISALMTVAVTGAFLIGQWPEAAMVMALYAIAEALEARAVDRARHAITGLMALAPEQAEVQQADGQWLTQPVGAVAMGSTVRVRPGARVPLDGTVTRGRSSIDQSPVTGESLPVDKAVGDPVFAGTVNQAGELEFEVSAPASRSTLARIIEAVEQAQGSRAPTQRFVDRFAAVYTPAVFLVALAVALGTPLLLGWSWSAAVYKALVLLVIACPCALVISTPVTVVSALAWAARRGILIKGGSHLESARGLKAVAFDKTGTLTAGKPRLVDWAALQGEPGQAAALAARLAGRSDHPVSIAIVAGLPAVVTPTAAVDGFEALPGRGVQATLDGHAHVLGNRRLIEERGQLTPAVVAALKPHEDAGRSVTLLAGEGGVLAFFAVADTLKPSSREAVSALKAMGVTPVLLSGDNAATVRAIAAEVGIEEAQGELLPGDKQAAVKALQQRHGATAMAGDGINDAPALAQADIGIAMGGAGTDIAMEAADVVIMNDDLRHLPATIALSRRTHTVLWQNIAFALGVKAVFFGFAVFGSATMWMAVFADMGTSLLVVANGMRLLRGGEGRGE